MKSYFLFENNRLIIYNCLHYTNYHAIRLDCNRSLISKFVKIKYGVAASIAMNAVSSRENEKTSTNQKKNCLKQLHSIDSFKEVHILLFSANCGKMYKSLKQKNIYKQKQKTFILKSMQDFFPINKIPHPCLLPHCVKQCPIFCNPQKFVRHSHVVSD